MSNVRQIKKGERVFDAGQKADRVFLIQSGLVSVVLPRPKKNIELVQASTGHILGDEAIVAQKGLVNYSTTAIALNDVNVIELQVELIRGALEKSPPITQLVVKALLEKSRAATGEIKAVRIERDTTPCPPDNVAKVFGVIHHVARQVGARKADRITVPWLAFKRYAQRVFLESPIRLEGACHILVNLGLADYEMVKDETDPDPDAPMVLGFFHFFDLYTVERFFEFFQNYHFKGDNPALLKTDEKVTALVQALVTLSEHERVDRRGVVYLNFKQALDDLKKLMGPNFNPDHFRRIEQKGLFLKRESNATGGAISFYRQEYVDMLQSWSILREVEKWNDRGIVDLVAPELRPRVPKRAPPPIATPTAAPDAATPPVQAEAAAAAPIVSADAGIAEPVPVAEIAAKSAERLCPVCLSKTEPSQSQCSVCGNELGSASTPQAA